MAGTTYYARLGPRDTVATPRQVLRRVHTATVPVEECLDRDGEWRPSDVLTRVERGEIPGRLAEIPEVWATTLADSAREKYLRVVEALDGQMNGRFALRMAREASDTGNDTPLEPDERGAVVAFLANATQVPGGLRTDGFWVWPESVARLAGRDGLAPEPELLHHIRKRQYQVPPALAPEVLARAARLASAPPDATGRVREAAPPGGQPPPTRAERLRALADWHREWHLRHASRTPFRPDDRPDTGESDYGLHYVDVEASPDAEWEFTRRAREIMGLDPTTGLPIDE